MLAQSYKVWRCFCVGLVDKFSKFHRLPSSAEIFSAPHDSELLFHTIRVYSCQVQIVLLVEDTHGERMLAAKPHTILDPLFPFKHHTKRTAKR